ncbi:Preprotein translocase subunit SCY2, chloroplastic [Dichanthelium oligosanthes]|uniref:Preprotein translocase subunit SCY2, chloroplastic n=1 Tax=Dichanthelium oligosanthes TaxID=888268 RepID=A0A1E5WAP8_9POAL|nr:Preprotein translocase subunit SCY2, chloroplastic [Dichanthelium oligosanthes]
MTAAAAMSPSLALAQSSLLLPPRRTLLVPPPRRLAPNLPSLRAHCRLLACTSQRPLLTPRCFALAAASAAEPARGDGDGVSAAEQKGTGYRNRFLDLARLGAVVEGAAEAFFCSEIRRRLAVTAALIVLSRVGYFIPLPGFDRRLIPDSYLSFAPLPADDLVDFSSELKLSFFQLGISHQISASIVMQMVAIFGFCNCGCFYCIMLFPTVFSICCKLQTYQLINEWGTSGLDSVQVVKHIIITSLLLVLGAMSMTWICDTISESGFGNFSKCWPYILGVAGIFMMLTMGAVLVTEGCRKIKLQYYGFKLASGAGNESTPVTEVEPYIPFNINPTGMQPLLTTSYLLAFPSIMASIFGSRFWENMKEILNPRTSAGGSPWVYYLTYAFLVFVFNIFDIANLPKEISDYLNKMSARVPKIKPGRATVDYLTKIQTSTRFWGGLLLSLLATSSLLLDRYLRQINEGFSIGFTSVLIIVSTSQAHSSYPGLDLGKLAIDSKILNDPIPDHVTSVLTISLEENLRSMLCNFLFHNAKLNILESYMCQTGQQS